MRHGKVLAAISFTTAVSLSAPLSYASSYSVLHTFAGTPDGQSALGGVLVKEDLLYGTTSFSGVHNHGTVYAVDPKTHAETVLYSFAGEEDGASPKGALMWYAHSLWGPP